MAASYSERLLQADATDAWTSWTCPAGHRAVVKSVVLTNNTSTAAQLGVFLAGAVFWVGSVPGFSSLASPVLTIACYATESIDAYTSSSSTVVTVGGFLFRDLTRVAGPPGDVVVSEDPPPHLLDEPLVA